MTNFANQIKSAAKGETIRGIVVSYEDYWGDEPRPGPAEMKPFIPVHLTNKVLTWRQAKVWLDREFSTGFGGAECYPIYAWTDSFVLFVHEYDGSTHVAALPRNPTDGRASYSG